MPLPRHLKQPKKKKRPISDEIGRYRSCLPPKRRHHSVTQSTRCFKSTTEAVDLTWETPAHFSLETPFALEGWAGLSPLQLRDSAGL